MKLYHELTTEEQRDYWKKRWESASWSASQHYSKFIREEARANDLERELKNERDLIAKIMHDEAEKHHERA